MEPCYAFFLNAGPKRLGSNQKLKISRWNHSCPRELCRCVKENTFLVELGKTHFVISHSNFVHT